MVVGDTFEEAIAFAHADLSRESPELLVALYRSWHIVASQARVLLSKVTYNTAEKTKRVRTPWEIAI
jgi:hypothetical protein